MGLYHGLRGEHDEALKWYEKGIRLNPFDVTLRRNKAVSLRLLGRPTEAAAELRHALQTAPDSSELKQLLRECESETSPTQAVRSAPIASR
jgi:tetratricopeptide (TPR) repeat protein